MIDLPAEERADRMARAEAADHNFEVFQRPTRAPTARTPEDRTCGRCRLLFETVGALEVHHCAPEKTVECDQCGRVCGNRTGLAQHRKFKHPDVPTSQSIVPSCPDCGERFTAFDDLKAHVDESGRCKALGGLAEEEIEEALNTPPARQNKYRFIGSHRSAREDTAFGGKRVYCECGWVTPPFDDRGDAREAFARHLDEMEAARHVADPSDVT